MEHEGKRRGMELATQAIDADRNGDLELAFQSYTEAVSSLLANRHYLSYCSDFTIHLQARLAMVVSP